MASHQPKYRDIIDWLLAEIAAGKYSEGDQIPSEYQLMEQFAYSRQTVRRALDELVKEHYLTRVKGSGTYVGQRYRKRNYNSIAVIVTYVDNYIFPKTIKGISDVLSASGYSMSVYYTDDNILKERENLELLLNDNHIDGIIIEPAKSALHSPNQDLYDRLRDLKLPVLFINAIYPNFSCPCIRIDDQKIGFDAANYLIQSGHRKIGGIFHLDDIQGHLRYAGFVEAMVKANIPFDSGQICWLDSTGYLKTDSVLPYFVQRLKSCSAVFCYNDFVATQFINYCQKNKIRIPQDISVIGVDNASFATGLEPGLTTFNHPQYYLGRQAANTILNMVENMCAGKDHIFPSQLIVRDSVCRFLNE